MPQFDLKPIETANAGPGHNAIGQGGHGGSPGGGQVNPAVLARLSLPRQTALPKSDDMR